MPPTTRYAKSGDVHIAYQVVGEGPLDLVLVPGWVSHVENAWEEPSFARFLRRLTSFCRLILLDRRGTGLSDPVATLPTLEQRMDDVRAVMDAAGSEHATLFGISEGGPMCILFAATYPDRTAALVLYGTFARGLSDPEYPWGITPTQMERLLARIDREWGTGITAKLFAPSIAQDEQHVQSWGRFERLAVSPGAARVLLQIAFDSDVRHVLPSIRVPTLVLHRSGDPAIHVDGARYMAERIAGAKYVELPGGDHFPWTGVIWTPFSMRSRSSSRVPDRARKPTGCLSRYCSRILSVQLSEPSNWEIVNGATSLSAITALSGGNCIAFGVGKSTRLVTPSLLPLTDRRELSAARVPSGTLSQASGSPSERGCTRVSVKRWATRSAGLLCISGHAWWDKPAQARSSSRAQSKTW